MGNKFLTIYDVFDIPVEKRTSRHDDVIRGWAIHYNFDTPNERYTSEFLYVVLKPHVSRGDLCSKCILFSEEILSSIADKDIPVFERIILEYIGNMLVENLSIPYTELTIGSKLESFYTGFGKIIGVLLGCSWSDKHLLKKLSDSFIEKCYALLKTKIPNTTCGIKIDLAFIELYYDSPLFERFLKYIPFFIGDIILHLYKTDRYFGHTTKTATASIPSIINKITSMDNCIEVKLSESASKYIHEHHYSKLTTLTKALIGISKI